VPTGNPLIIEKSTNLPTWTQATSVPVVGGIATYKVDTKTGDKVALFRGKVQ
jgi:hypothetical protein